LFVRVDERSEGLVGHSEGPFPVSQAAAKARILRFGMFELDIDAQQLQRAGRVVKLQPQPFRLLCLLANRAGHVVTRDEIRSTLWGGDTFVDFDQGVNYAIRQIREGLREDAEHPVYIQTIPRRGYKFVAPVTEVDDDELPPDHSGTLALAKAMWANISDLQLAEQRREARWKTIKTSMLVAGVALTVLAVVAIVILTS
jgi:DNA-binding winged helix-turn-helix (wHTH) protein